MYLISIFRGRNFVKFADIQCVCASDVGDSYRIEYIDHMVLNVYM